MASKGLSKEQMREIELNQKYSKKIVDKLTNEQKEELYQKIVSDRVDEFFGGRIKGSYPLPKSNTTLLGIVMFFVGIFILYIIFK